MTEPSFRGLLRSGIPGIKEDPQTSMNIALGLLGSGPSPSAADLQTQVMSRAQQGGVMTSPEAALAGANKALNYFGSFAGPSPSGGQQQQPQPPQQQTPPTVTTKTPYDQVSSFWTPAMVQTTWNQLNSSNNHPEYASGIKQILASPSLSGPQQQAQLENYFDANPWLKTFYGGYMSVNAFKQYSPTYTY